MYVTGACGALYDGASPDGSKDQKQIARVHQAYGRDYQLPNSTAHNETCAAIGNVLWNWRMLQLTGEAKYADVLELALYNAVLAGVEPRRQAVLLHEHAPPARHDAGAAAVVAEPRGVDQLLLLPAERRPHRRPGRATYAYGRSDRGVWVHLYGGSTLDTTLPDGRRVKLTQETDYPWDGRVKLTVEAAPAGECVAVPPRPRLGRRGDARGERQAGGRRPPAGTPRCGAPGRTATWSN